MGETPQGIGNIRRQVCAPSGDSFSVFLIPQQMAQKDALQKKLSLVGLLCQGISWLFFLSHGKCLISQDRISLRDKGMKTQRETWTRSDSSCLEAKIPTA